MLEYQNPILMSDYSDPDVIRVNDDYFMISSSFNYFPGIPILHSKNLIDWEIINYVFDKLDSYFDIVRHGEGAWAPSLRYFNNTFYCFVPIYGRGIYYFKTNDIYSKWSKPILLIKGKGLIDPCPLFIHNRCYIVFAFAKSKIGFNSVLAIHEFNIELTKRYTKKYKIIYDGHNDNPTIEGPKLYYINDYYYILAPAGGVKNGWQTCLRSKSIYGKYETKIVLMQGDTNINGPHQGALIDINTNEYAFIHFRDMNSYGRTIYLEPVSFINNWPIIGKIKDPLLFGEPVSSNQYLINLKSNYKLDFNKDFQTKLLLWQTPANKKDNIYTLTNNGLKMNAINDINKPLHLLETCLYQKIMYLNFNIQVECALNLNNNEEVGFTLMGQKYTYLAIKKEANKYILRLTRGSFDEDEQILLEEIYPNESIIFNLKFRYKEKDKSYYQIGYNNKYFNQKFISYKGRWVGAHIGLYARGNNKGFVYFKNYKVKRR